MFRKRIKKEYPPGTFLPKPQRILAIIQLCIAFTAIAWNAGQPFMGQLFAVKSRLLLYKYALGQEDFFNALSEDEQGSIQAGFQALTTLSNISFTDKLTESFRILLFELPPFEKAWILLSLVMPIMLLKKVEGARHAVWILPLVVLLYGIDNQYRGLSPRMTQEALLFPSEQVLVEDYLKEPLSKSIMEQHEQLKRAWDLYLIDRWVKESPAGEPVVFAQQVAKGRFAFNVARIKALEDEPPVNNGLLFHKRLPLGLIGLYLGWNVLFAWVLSRDNGVKRLSKI